jgi:hypothetical protein
MRSLLPFTRAVYVAGFCLTIGTGVGLYAVPGRTADYWAWTIKAPLSAAFFGAGYIGAALALFPAARSPTWERTRTVAVEVLALTSLALLVTLLDLDPFAFGAGGLPEVVAWIWLLVYVSLPPAVLIAFVLQERSRDGTNEPETQALYATRLALGASGVVLSLVGIALLADWGALASRWPWPLPSLPATMVGAWLCTSAAALLWFAVVERSWERVRIGMLPVAATVALDLGAAARFSGDLRGGASTAVYLSCSSILLLLLAAAAIVEERRLSNRRATGRAGRSRARRARGLRTR